MTANNFYSTAIKNIENRCFELKSCGIDVSFVSIIDNNWIGSNKTKILVHCNKHNIDYVVRYNEFLSDRHRGCPECKKENLSSSIKRYKTEEEVVSAIKNKIDNEHLNIEFCGFIDSYSTLSKTRIKVRCTRHETIGTPNYRIFS